MKSERHSRVVLPSVDYPSHNCSVISTPACFFPLVAVRSHPWLRVGISSRFLLQGSVLFSRLSSLTVALWKWSDSAEIFLKTSCPSQHNWSDTANSSSCSVSVDWPCWRFRWNRDSLRLETKWLTRWNWTPQSVGLGRPLHLCLLF